MRSHSATCLLMPLLVSLLLGAAAAPADAQKRPRRYEETYLVTWQICPIGAKLTIGYKGLLDDDPETPDDDPGPGEPAPTDAVAVDVDAELPSTPGTSLIEGGPRHVEIPDIEDEEIDFSFIVNDDFVTDEHPDPPNRELITHRKALDLVWSRTVPVGELIRLGFSNPEHKWGRFRIESCLPFSPPDGGGSGGSSPGVTTGSSVSTEKILDLFSRIDENREVGRGPGGSLVPRSQCTIVGTPDKDRVEGTRGNDVICGLGGNDVIHGGGGLDLIDCADGNDRVSGGSGQDVLVGLRGDDRLNGNRGDDRIGDGAGNGRVSGSSGNDRLGGGSGDDRLSGGKGRDGIRSGSGNDSISAHDRTRDTVDGGTGQDRATVDGLGSGRRPTGARRADRVRRVERLR